MVHNEDVGEMAQWIECLLHKHGDLSLDVQHTGACCLPTVPGKQRLVDPQVLLLSQGSPNRKPQVQ